MDMSEWLASNEKVNASIKNIIDEYIDYLDCRDIDFHGDTRYSVLLLSEINDLCLYILATVAQEMKEY